MIEECVTPAEMVTFLNSLLEMDRCAIDALLACRVPCSEAMAAHPSVQVSTLVELTSRERTHQVGVLGVLNGAFGAYGPEGGSREGSGCIAVRVDEGGRVVGFELLLPRVV